MLLQISTWPEIEAYLQRSGGIIIPIGSTEQHGPNGLIGTDAICAETIARGVEQNVDTVIAPTISVGMAQHHLGFPGSISLRPSTLIAVIRDTLECLRLHGFTHCYFLNGHGGNIATVSAAFSEVHADTSLSGRAQPRDTLRCKLANWYQSAGARALSAELYASAEGSHATPSEVSLTWFAHPDAVNSVEMNPRIAPTGPILDAADYRRRFPDGRIGSDPSLATAEAGRRIHDAAVKDITRDYQEFLATD